MGASRINAAEKLGRPNGRGTGEGQLRREGDWGALETYPEHSASRNPGANAPRDRAWRRRGRAHPLNNCSDDQIPAGLFNRERATAPGNGFLS